MYKFIIKYQDELTNILAVLTSIYTIISILTMIIQSSTDLYRSVIGGSLSAVLYLHGKPKILP